MEKKVAESLGYSIGRRRWAKAGQPTEEANRGGRPSTADQPHAIAAVQALHFLTNFLSLLPIFARLVLIGSSPIL